jgi:hypothetical protein
MVVQMPAITSLLQETGWRKKRDIVLSFSWQVFGNLSIRLRRWRDLLAQLFLSTRRFGIVVT